MATSSSGSGGSKNINPNQQRKRTPRKYKVAKDNRRSEEHTSELQSH